MVSSLSITPMATTNASGLFGLDSDGLIQGFAFDDPSARNWLAGGILSSLETLPMFGGVGITENIPPAFSSTGNQSELGGQIRRATNISTVGAALSLTGFSVFDQAHHMINSPNNPVPLALSGMTVQFYRLGSNARIQVACDPQLIDQRGNPITTQVSWDFVNQRLIEYSPAYAQGTITNAVWASTNGGQVTYTVGTDYTANLGAGDAINVANVVNTGGAGGATNVFNGAFNVVSVTSTTIVVSYPASASPGTYASGGNVLAGGGALPVRLIRVKQTNCMTVTTDVNGNYVWNKNGSAAVILI